MSVVEDGALPAASLFSNVVGQDAAVGFLRAAARRPVHAYLFVGKQGAGAAGAARAFAAALLCPHGGCGRCTACARALAGSHPDLVELTRTGAAMAVDEARQLTTLALRHPIESVRQVIVLFDVHLAERAAPALLKTIEEPPPSTVFVLLGEDVPPSLATVASRCASVAFPPVPEATVAAWLAQRGVDADRARLVAEGAGGDLDRALLLSDDPAYVGRVALWRSVPGRLDGHGATAGAIAREIIGALDGAVAPLKAQHGQELEVLEDQAEALGQRGVPGRKDVTDRQRREERRWRTDDLRAGLGVLARAYRDRLVDAACAPVEQVGSAPIGSAPVGPAPGSRGHPEEMRAWHAAVGLIGEASEALGRNAQEAVLLEALFVRLGRLTA